MVRRRRKANPNSFMTLLLEVCCIHLCMMGTSPNLQSCIVICAMAGQDQISAWQNAALCVGFFSLPTAV